MRIELKQRWALSRSLSNAVALCHDRSKYLKNKKKKTKKNLCEIENSNPVSLVLWLLTKRF